MELPRNCANCEHYDGDGYCSLPRADRMLAGYIYHPASVVCLKHDPRLTMPEREEQARAIEERSLYRHPRY